MESIAEVKIGRIVVDPSLQPRIGGTDPAHVRVLEETPESWPPITVVRRDAQYLMIDGFHRLKAAKNLGLESVKAQVVEAATADDLHALAFSLNATHGRPLSLADRRVFAERILRDQPHLADREIARRSGLAANTVGSIRVRLEESAQIEQIDERVGRGGYVHALKRKPGDLPDADPVESISELFAPRERKRQRRIVHYLERLSVALEDQYKLGGWETHEEAAKACRNTLDEERVAEFAQELGDASYNVLQVAIALGYDPDSE
jgi:ParB-like chromosome segregation protein Spo0J